MADQSQFAWAPAELAPSAWKLPIGDLEHVQLAAEAMGTNPPHGHGAEIPAKDHAAVKDKIRARAKELGAADDVMAKINAHLGRKSAPGRLSDSEQAIWDEAYNEALAQTGDDTMAKQAADGSLYKSRLVYAKKDSSGDVIVAGWGLLFTDNDHLDLSGTYFDQQTQLLAEYYPNAPLWLEHGQQKKENTVPIGKRASLKVFPRGIWAEHTLDQNDPRFNDTVAGINRGEYVYSSDSILHHVTAGWEPEDGRLGVWPLAGWSLVKAPAEPALGPVSIKQFEEAFKGARDALDATKNHVTQEDSNMKPDAILKMLGDFLGCDPTVEAVGPELNDYIADMNESGSVDPAVVAAMGMEVGGGDEPVEPAVMAGKLMDMYNSATVPDDKPAAKKRNAEALKSFAKSEEGVNPIPAYGAGTPDGKKSTTYGGVNISKNTAVPGVSDLVLGILGHKSPAAMKALGYTAGPAGGWLARRETSEDMINLFYANVAVMKSGATIVPMDGIETLTYRKIVSGASAYWRGEFQAATESQLADGVVNLNLKELVGATRVANKLLKNGVRNLEQIIRGDIDKAVHLKADLSFLTGTGAKTSGNSGAEPLGVLNTAGVTTTVLATNGKVLSPTDMVNGYGVIEDANVPASGSWGAITSPRTRRTIRNTADSVGQLIPEERFTQGYGLQTTTQISNTLTVGASSNTSNVYLGAWEYLIIGMGQDVEFTVDSSRYVELGETYIQAIMYVDAAVSHPEAFNVLTGVKA